jgi:hypothetical protein
MSEHIALFKEHDENWSWFEKHYDELVERFDGEFVAVYKQSVIDHGKKMRGLMERIESSYPADRVFVEFVSREKHMMVL